MRRAIGRNLNMIIEKNHSPLLLCESLTKMRGVDKSIR
jgi:hypothetical protein